MLISKQYCLTRTPPSSTNLTIICPTCACMSSREHSCHCNTSNFLGSLTVYSGLENLFTFSSKDITNQNFTAQEIFLRQKLLAITIRCRVSFPRALTRSCCLRDWRVLPKHTYTNKQIDVTSVQLSLPSQRSPPSPSLSLSSTISLSHSTLFLSFSLSASSETRVFYQHRPMSQVCTTS